MELVYFEMILKIILLSTSLFIPGYFVLSSKYRILVPFREKFLSKNKNLNNSASSHSDSIQISQNSSFFNLNLSTGEFIACCFVISIFLITGINFVIGILGGGITEFFNLYFIASSILTGLFIIINGKTFFKFFSKSILKRKINLQYALPILFVAIPLFHLFGFGKLNWDAFVFFIRDSLVMGMTNNIPNYYPSSFYPEERPMIFFSYLASSLYLYAIDSLNLLNLFENKVIDLAEFTTNSLIYLPLATFATTLIRLGSFAKKIFQRTELVIATLILFIMMPLLNMFFYYWSLYADLFFAFETLFVIVFMYRFLQTNNSNHRIFNFLMLVIGLSLAILTKNYGAILLVVFPIIFVVGKFYSPSRWKNLNRRHLALYFLIFLAISGVVIAYVIRDIELTGSPFKYSIKSLADFTPEQKWAKNIIESTGITQNPENYPEKNQQIALLLSYGFYPVLLIPLIIGIVISIINNKSKLGMVGVFVVFFYVMWLTILEMRIDRHLFAILPLLPLLYVLGIKKISDLLKWKKNYILLLVLGVVILQLPIFNSFYHHGDILGFLNDYTFWNSSETLYEMIPFSFNNYTSWYSENNLFDILIYSVLGFGAIIVFGIIYNYFTVSKRSIENLERKKLTKKLKIDKTNKLTLVLPMIIFSIVFSITILSPIDNILSSPKTENYGEFLDSAYLKYHFNYLDTLQEVLDITSEGDKPTILYFHGWGTEYFTMGNLKYMPIKNFQFFGSMQQLLTEKEPALVREILLEKNIDYILLPSTSNHHILNLRALSFASDKPIILSNPSLVASEKIELNQYWDLYRI